LDADRACERFGLAAPPAVLSRVWLAWSLAEQGFFVEAVNCAEAARSLAEASGRRLDLGYALRGGALTYLRMGDLDHAREWSERLFDLSRAEGLGLNQPMGLAILGYAEALAGQMARARPLLAEALADSAQRHISVFDPLLGAWLGEVLMLEGRFAEAQDQT